MALARLLMDIEVLRVGQVMAALAEAAALTDLDGTFNYLHRALRSSAT
jgi:hypothetical protein